MSWKMLINDTKWKQNWYWQEVRWALVKNEHAGEALVTCVCTFLTKTINFYPCFFKYFISDRCLSSVFACLHVLTACGHNYHHLFTMTNNHILNIFILFLHGQTGYVVDMWIWFLKPYTLLPVQYLYLPFFTF